MPATPGSTLLRQRLGFTYFVGDWEIDSDGIRTYANRTYGEISANDGNRTAIRGHCGLSNLGTSIRSMAGPAPLVKSFGTSVRVAIPAESSATGRPIRFTATFDQNVMPDRSDPPRLTFDLGYGTRVARVTLCAAGCGQRTCTATASTYWPQHRCSRPAAN